MSKTIDEMMTEIMSDEALSRELMTALNEPVQVAVFLKKHDCDETVSEFLARLDNYNE